MIRPPDIQRTLAPLEIRTVANDYRAALYAANYGQFLSDAAPRSYLRRDIANLAREIAAVAPVAAMTKAGAA